MDKHICELHFLCCSLGTDLGMLTSLLTCLGPLGPLPSQHPVVRNALFCLESAWKSAKEGPHGSHVYTKALLAYAFALAGNQDKRRDVLTSLNQEAVHEGELPPILHSLYPQLHCKHALGLLLGSLSPLFSNYIITKSKKS